MRKYTSTPLWVVIAVFVSAIGSVMANPPPPAVPDGGSSALLLGAACFGAVAVRRFFSKGK